MKINKKIWGFMLLFALSGCAKTGETAVTPGSPLTGTSPLPAPSQQAAQVTAQPTTSGSSDPSGVTPTDQPAAALPPVFDLTRTKDHPITDAQQIINILEALERIQRLQPVPVGWYLGSNNDLINPENPEKFYFLYHVIDEDLNCDMAMNFQLSPDGNTLWWMTRDYGLPIQQSQGRALALWKGDDYVCNLSNPNLAFYYSDYYADTFSLTVQGWLKPGAEQYGEYSFSAWFENEKDQPVFVLQESADNMRLAYQADPDTKELVAIQSREEKRTYSTNTGFLIELQFTTILVNNKIRNKHSLIQKEYYPEMDELPPSVLTYLEESLRKYDELQTP